MTRKHFNVARIYDDGREPIFLQTKAGWLESYYNAKQFAFIVDAELAIQAVDQLAKANGLDASGRLTVIRVTIEDGTVTMEDIKTGELV